MQVTSTIPTKLVKAALTEMIIEVLKDEFFTDPVFVNRHISASVFKKAAGCSLTEFVQRILSDATIQAFVAQQVAKQLMTATGDDLFDLVFDSFEVAYTKGKIKSMTKLVADLRESFPNDDTGE